VVDVSGRADDDTFHFRNQCNRSEVKNLPLMNTDDTDQDRIATL
jgi:hypothetical protein